MAIEVGEQGRIGVAERLRRHLRRHPAGQHESGARVAEAARCQWWQSDLGADLFVGIPSLVQPVAAAEHAINVRVLRQASRMVCWSSWCAGSAIADYGVAPERVEVIPPGVDLSIWRPGVGSGSTDRLRVLFVGGDLDRKGGLMLIDAFRRLSAGRAELHLVTETPYQSEAEGVVVHSGLAPNSPELISLYQA